MQQYKEVCDKINMFENKIGKEGLYESDSNIYNGIFCNIRRNR